MRVQSTFRLVFQQCPNSRLQTFWLVELLKAFATPMSSKHFKCLRIPIRRVELEEALAREVADVQCDGNNSNCP